VRSTTTSTASEASSPRSSSRWRRSSCLASTSRGSTASSLEADVQRIALLDGPAVLGWEEWYEVETKYGLGLIEGGLRAAADAGQIKPVPAAELAVMLLGALTEAALLLARAEDPDAARERSGAALRALIEGLRTG
jgi:hypothetical protein